MNELERMLAGYGVWLLAKQLGQQPLREGPLVWNPDVTRQSEADMRVAIARRLLEGEAVMTPLKLHDNRLLSIFAFVDPPVGVYDAQADTWQHRELRLDTVATSFKPVNGRRAVFWTEESEVSADALWITSTRVLEKVTPETHFETFYNLFARIACFVRGTLRDPFGRDYGDAISVFEQWKATAALAHCLDPQAAEEQRVLLVAGDLPGIQDMLYTITSQGAAKSLRSRSLYLQLLNDAVVRVILRELGLPWANVIFSAGGNFRLLTRLSDEPILHDLREELNRRLLELHRGGLFAALTWIPISARAVADHRAPDRSSEIAVAQHKLSEKLETEKRRAFADLAKQDEYYEALFSPLGKGGPTFSNPETGERNYCEVCQAEIDPPRRVFADGINYCWQCASFGSEQNGKTLAKQLADSKTLIVKSTCDQLSKAPPIPEKYMTREFGNAPWDKALSSLGFEFSFTSERRPDIEDGIVYALNNPDFYWRPRAGVSYGFRFLSKLTPRVSGDKGDIRDIHVMARDDATGIARYGVLRMDIDGLGQVLTGRLRYPDLPHLSALSAALSYFFEGVLDEVCRAVAKGWRSRIAKITGQEATDEENVKLPYVIYAGGDDLLLVGPWDVLPAVAQHLHQAVDVYTGGHLSLSGGVSLGTEKFPLYQAAALALDALDRAKDHEVRNEDGLIEIEKNAFTFLNVTVGWDEWPQVVALSEELAELVAVRDGTTRAPRSLLQTLGVVAKLYQDAATDAGVRRTSRKVQLGSWVWALHYGLRRVATRVPALKSQILRLANTALNLKDPAAPRGWRTVRYLDLAVRWAEFLTRKKEDET